MITIKTINELSDLALVDSSTTYTVLQNISGTSGKILISVLLAGVPGLVMTSLGDMIYGAAGTGAHTRLAGSTSATKMFLSQTGNGTSSAAPSWSTVSKSDVGLGNVANISAAPMPSTTLGGKWYHIASGDNTALVSPNTGTTWAYIAFFRLTATSITYYGVYASGIIAANTQILPAEPTANLICFLYQIVY